MYVYLKILMKKVVDPPPPQKKNPAKSLHVVEVLSQCVSVDISKNQIKVPLCLHPLLQAHDIRMVHPL